MRFALLLLVVVAALPARAAGVDMSTQTCQDWIDADDDAQDRMLAWLRGYIAGRSTSTLYNMASARADMQTLRAYCQGHAETGVISAASQLGK